MISGYTLEAPQVADKTIGSSQATKEIVLGKETSVGASPSTSASDIRVRRGGPQTRACGPSLPVRTPPPCKHQPVSRSFVELRRLHCAEPRDARLRSGLALAVRSGAGRQCPTKAEGQSGVLGGLRVENTSASGLAGKVGEQDGKLGNLA